MASMHSGIALIYHARRCICPLCVLLRLVMHTAVIPMAVLGPDETSRLTGGPLGAAGDHERDYDGPANTGRVYDIRTYGGRQARAGESGSIGKGKGRAKTNDRRRSVLERLAPFLARPAPPKLTRARRRSSSASSASPSGSNSDTDSDSSSARMGTSYFDRGKLKVVHGRTDLKSHHVAPAVSHPYMPLPADTKTRVRPDHCAIDVLSEDLNLKIVDAKAGTDELDDRIRKNDMTRGRWIVGGPGANALLYAPTPSYSSPSTSTSYTASPHVGGKDVLISTPASRSSPSHWHRNTSPSTSADRKRPHAVVSTLLGREWDSITSVDARHMLQGTENETRSIIETAPFKLAHTRLELAVHVGGVLITVALIVLSVWLTIADIRM